jgi:arsenate reductase
MIRAVGIEPTIIEYLKTPLSREEIKNLVRLIGEPLRSLIREKGTPFHDLGLGRADISDDELLDAIGQHPVLLNRPIVVTEKGAALCRPSERVLDLLPYSLTKDFVKEDGEIVRVGGGNPS